MLAILGLAAFAARRYLALRDALTAVPTDLRSPFMAISFPTTARTVPFFRRPFRLTLPSGPGVTITNRPADGVLEVPVRITMPDGSDSNRPAVLWIHGGGTVIGSPQFESPTLGLLARELGAVVVSPDYRLAPEHPFPAALDDCMATLRWMCDHADELGINVDRIAVAGVSAGGGLAAAVAQRSHDEGIPLCAQVIVYGMLDDRTVLTDDHGGRGEFVVTPSGYQFAWTAYLGRQVHSSHAPQYAAPSRRTDLTGLPPTWVGVGDVDLLYPENVAYAEKLKACGVPCELITVAGMYHGADGLAPKAQSMREFQRSMLDHLQTYLHAA